MHSVDVTKPTNALAHVQRMIEVAEREARKLEAQLASAAFDATEDARTYLSNARKELRWAAGDIERARNELVLKEPDERRR